MLLLCVTAAVGASQGSQSPASPMETVAAHLTHTSPKTHHTTYLLDGSRLRCDSGEVCTYVRSQTTSSSHRGVRLRSIGAGSGIQTHLPARASGSLDLKLLGVHYGMPGQSATQAQHLCACALQYPINQTISQSISQDLLAHVTTVQIIHIPLLSLTRTCLGEQRKVIYKT